MEKKTVKRNISFLLVVLMTFGCLFTHGTTALASDTLPYLGESAKGENQPYEHGYRVMDVEHWSPLTDPYAEFMRAQIPLQTRIDAFSATQANTNLNSETQMFALAGDYGNAFFDSYPYTNEFSQYLFNFWQYTDYYGSWHGMPTTEVPESLYVDERGVTDAWKYRAFEFGVINMPNPGYTNAAHKNGVMSIGCIFFPRTGQSHKDMLKQDESGRYIIADKLVEICNYYGFDGWFINQEEAIPSSDVPLYKEFMKQMRDDGIYVQWYDSITQSGGISYQNQFNSTNAPYVKSGNNRYSDSIFLNYWWSASKLKNSAQYAKNIGLNPLTTVFAGIEAGGDRWNQHYDLRNNLNSSGQPMNAIASLGSEFVHDGLDEDLDGGVNNNVEMRREKDEYQWMTFQRERMWWSGLNEDPTKVLRSSTLTNSSIGVNTGTKWDGISAYITERSVISGDTFVTNFNTGHGLEYVKSGMVSSNKEWSNIIIQDILPTWQWWMDTKGNRLTVDFDYGSKYTKKLANKTTGSFPYSLVGAYEGGSSLVVAGNLNAETFLHLYKTELDVSNTSTMRVTYKKTSNDHASMKLGILFKDSPNSVVKLNIVNPVYEENGWSTGSVDLSAFAGRVIAAIGLVFEGSAPNYQMNIGKLRYTSASDTIPQTPTGLAIEKAYDSSEMVVRWEKESYDLVKQYNIYAVINGVEQFMGGTYDDIYYIKDLGGVNGNVIIRLRAVSKDGIESSPAETSFDYSAAVSNVSVNAFDGQLNVSWTNPSGVSISGTNLVVTKEYEDDATEYTMSVIGATNNTTIPVPGGADADGTRYTMTITPLDESGMALSTISYDGKLDDSYSVPYNGRISNNSLTIPESEDWWKLQYQIVNNGTPGTTTTITRGVNAMPTLSSDVSQVRVILVDYAGNHSDAVIVSSSGVISSPVTPTPTPTTTPVPTVTPVPTETPTPTPGPSGTVSNVAHGATVLGVSSTNSPSNEQPANAFDEVDTTKWCVANASSGWIAFDLGNVYTIEKFRTIHGEMTDGSSGFNTKAFALEVLTDPNPNASNLRSNTYLGNNSNWTQVAYVDNSNLNMIVEIELKNVSGRYFRLRVDDSCANQWTAIRIHEIQLMGY